MGDAKKTITSKSPMATVAVYNINTEMMIDTGASVNAMDERAYEIIHKSLLIKHGGPMIMPNGGGSPLHVIGVYDATLESKSANQCHRFRVIKGAHGSLIGFNTAQEVGVVNIINTIDRDWKNKYPGLTKGIGKLKGVQVKLHIDESVRLVAIINQKIIFHMRPKIDEEEQ